MKQLNSKQFTQIPDMEDCYQVGHFVDYTPSNSHPYYAFSTLSITSEHWSNTKALIKSIPDGTVWSSDYEHVVEILTDDQGEIEGVNYSYMGALMFKKDGKFGWTNTKNGYSSSLYKIFSLDEEELNKYGEWLTNEFGLYCNKTVYHTGKLGKPIPTVVTHFLTLDNNDMIILWNTTAAPLNSEEANQLLKKTHYAPVVDENNPSRYLYTEFDTITVVKDDYYTAEMTSKRAIANDVEWHLGVAVYETADGHKQYSLPYLIANQKKQPTGAYMWRAQINDKDNYGFGAIEVGADEDCWYDSTSVGDLGSEKEGTFKGWEVIA